MKFRYFGKELDTFDHLYNCTYMNERCVELAVAFDFLQGRSFVNGLEVGNVMGHYDVGAHTVVDLYEGQSELQKLKGWPVHQLDLFDIGNEVGSSWDWIVAISTLEHVRFDMDPNKVEVDLDGSMNAIVYLRSLLEPSGKMLVTLPCGFHPVLDELITEELTGATRSATFVRTEDIDGWVQTDTPMIIDYGTSTPWADSVWIGEFDRL